MIWNVKLHDRVVNLGCLNMLYLCEHAIYPYILYWCKLLVVRCLDLWEFHEIRNDLLIIYCYNVNFALTFHAPWFVSNNSFFFFPHIFQVIIYAALYLKLRRYPDQQGDIQEKYAARITEILNPERIGGIGGDSCIHLLLKSNRDLRDLVFMKPLHVRIKFHCLDHPKAADNSKEIVVTNSSMAFNVSLHT